MSNFSPAWFLRSPHAQTIWGRLTRPRRLVSLRRESLTTPDGDELIVDHLDPSAALRAGGIGGLHFILMHGLEGSSNSVYIQGMLSAISRRGHAATAINFRSCARDPQNLGNMIPNRRPRFYHSGETGDFDFVIRTLAARNPQERFVAFGASLGGNVLLKWLGEHPEQTLVAAAAALSVPFDLGAGSLYLEKSVAGRIYVSRFLNTLIPKAVNAAMRFSDIQLDVEAVKRARTFREFDDVATAPLHGFTDANDYYARSSSIRFLHRIATPVLCLNAEDDPFLPPDVLPQVRDAASKSVDFRTTTHGGHVGFIAGRAPWSCEYWAEERAVEWLCSEAQ
ncbi:MAG TPA: alpha/beta fold hydrolase [Thermoanaerobaculia bacterium]|nr:alpha/beta fold hydrolase [Thermoanaerobaculia bacterium]